MKYRLMVLFDEALLCKRAFLETIIDEPRNVSQIERSRDPSPANLVAIMLAGLILYGQRPVKTVISS